MKKALKILLIIIAVVVAILAVVSLLAGPIAKRYVSRHGEDLIGRKVEVSHIGLNIFTGGLNVRGLTVFEDDATNRFAGFDTLDLRVHLLALPFKTVHLQHVDLVGLYANAEQQGDEFNFTSMLNHFASDTQSDDTTSLWKLRLYNIRLSHARIEYSDLNNGKTWCLPDVNVKVPGFSVGIKEESSGGLNVGFEKGGSLNIDAQMDAAMKNFSVDVALREFDVRNVEDFILDFVNCKRVEGVAYAHLSASGRLDEALKSSVRGEVGLSGFSINESAGKVVEMDSMLVKLHDFNPGDYKVDVESVALAGLKVRYEQWEDYSNISRLFADESERPSVTYATPVEEPQPDEKRSADAPQWKLLLRKLQVSGAKASYIDHTMPDKMQLALSNINVDAVNITLSGENNVRLSASFDGGGDVNLRWKGYLDQWRRGQQVSLSVKGVDLKQISPLVVAYTGMPITDGVFGLSSTASIVEGSLVNDNKIDIYKLQVGKRRKDVEPEYKIPLKTALYILKDKNDKILIDLPVRGNIDSPEFSYMKVVWKTLGQLLVKVATSPARALSQALGVNAEDIDFLVVDIQQPDLTSEQYHFLANLSKVASSTNSVRFIITPHFPNIDTDSAASHCEYLNSRVMQYLTSQEGCKDSFVMEAPSDADSLGRIGYSIASEVKGIEEEDF